MEKIKNVPNHQPDIIWIEESTITIAPKGLVSWVSCVHGIKSHMAVGRRPVQKLFERKFIWRALVVCSEKFEVIFTWHAGTKGRTASILQVSSACFRMVSTLTIVWPSDLTLNWWIWVVPLTKERPSAGCEAGELFVTSCCLSTWLFWEPVVVVQSSIVLGACSWLVARLETTWEPVTLLPSDVCNTAECCKVGLPRSILLWSPETPGGRVSNCGIQSQGYLNEANPWRAELTHSSWSCFSFWPAENSRIPKNWWQNDDLIKAAGETSQHPQTGGQIRWRKNTSSSPCGNDS